MWNYQNALFELNYVVSGTELSIVSRIKIARKTQGLTQKAMNISKYP